MFEKNERMYTLGIIPARYGSSRFPGKPLIDLKGKSMIRRVYEGAEKCTLFNEVVVATDDQRIYDHSYRYLVCFHRRMNDHNFACFHHPYHMRH